MKLFRQRLSQLRVHESRAADDGNAETMSRLQQRNAVRSHNLCRGPHRLCHRKIDGKLYNLEVMSLTTHLARDGHELLEAEMVSSFRQDSEAIPGRTPVIPDYLPPNLFLERGECGAHNVQELRAGHHLELLLRIV